MRSIVDIRQWPGPALEGLVAESETEGFRFLRRLQEEWHSGANRFAREGEVLCATFEGGRLVAIGGLNRVTARGGRLRRFYVARAARRQGIGRELVRHLLALAARHYERVELRTDTAAADRFYCAMGFSKLPPTGDATHAIDLGRAVATAAR
jgi:GNAT superfamily N-acetyltransferase